MNLFWLWLGLTFANFFLEATKRNPDLHRAVERSYFQAVPLICIWIFPSLVVGLT